MGYLVKMIVETIVEEAIRSYLDRKTSPKTKHVILDEIFPVERRIRSIVGGLEGSIGTKIWEKLSYKFASKSGFYILKSKEFYKPKFHQFEADLDQYRGALNTCQLALPD